MIHAILIVSSPTQASNPPSIPSPGSSEDKTALLDDIEQGVVVDAEWYAVRYHECDHDAPSDQRSGCPGWTTERSSGNVPSDV